MNDIARCPLKSTWRDPIGKRLTDARIRTRIREGWYGLIPKLKQMLRSSKKDERNKALEQLKRYNELPERVKKPKRTLPIDLERYL